MAIAIADSVTVSMAAVTKGTFVGDVTRELGLQLYRFRQYLGISGNKKDVIEGQTVHYNFICNK